MFEVGQKIWDVVRGEGRVVRIDNDLDYPVVVDFDTGRRESYATDGKYAEYDENISLYHYPVEVIKKMAKPTVNWDHVHSRYNYLAQDKEGTCWVYENIPIPREVEWVSGRGDCTSADCLQSLVPGTCSWEDSLVERPVV